MHSVAGRRFVHRPDERTVKALEERASKASDERSHIHEQMEASSVVTAALQREVDAIVAVVGEEAVKREERDQALDEALANTTHRDAHAQHVAHHASTLEQLQQLKREVEQGFARVSADLAAEESRASSQSSEDRAAARRGAEAAAALARRLVDGAVRDLLAAPHGAVAECRGRVARLEETSSKARAELDIALKFVDGSRTAERGHEHNMTARSIEGWTAWCGPRARRRAEPFSPSVRLAA